MTDLMSLPVIQTRNHRTLVPGKGTATLGNGRGNATKSGPSDTLTLPSCQHRLSALENELQSERSTRLQVEMELNRMALRREDLYRQLNFAETQTQKAIEENLFLLPSPDHRQKKPRHWLVRDYQNSLILRPGIHSKKPKGGTVTTSTNPTSSVHGGEESGNQGPISPTNPQSRTMPPLQNSVLHQNVGVKCGLVGKPSHPLPLSFLHKSAKRTRQFWDYQGRAYLVDLQDPPDMWLDRP